jgi:hypothetical protein
LEFEMSSFAYGALTSKRQSAPSETSLQTNPPGLGTYADTLAALVPAEAILAHAALLELSTDTTGEGTDELTSIITQPGILEVSFWGLLVVATFLFIVGKSATWDWSWDFVRMLIPAAAMAGWMLIQQPSAMDALGVTWSPEMRGAIAIFAALIGGGIAKMLAYKADAADPG